jgi:hypothetical protein
VSDQWSLPFAVSVLDDALRRHQSLSLRGEKHRAFAALFVDAHQLDLLDTPDWQVIYGQRGSGKTILLGALEQQLLSALDVSRVLPIRVSVEDTIVSPPFGAAIDHEQRALGYFEAFVELLGDELATATESLATKRRGLWASLTQRGGSQSDEAAELVRDLVAAVRTGMTLGAYSETAVQETTQHEVEASTKVEAALRAKTSANPVTVNASVGGARRALRKSGVVVTSSGAPVARFRSVRNGLIQLADMLELERIDILIDEWSLLDVSIQPIFANTLRQALARRFSRTVRGAMEISVNGEVVTEPALDVDIRVPAGQDEWKTETLRDGTKDDPDQMTEILVRLHDWKMLESRAILEIVQGRLQIVDKLAALLASGAPETPHNVGDENLHDLLADYPWIINPEWQVLAEEKTITKQLREWDTADADIDGDASRYDFLALTGDGHLVVIEIKRENHAVTLDEVQRLETYRARLEKSAPTVDMVLICGGHFEYKFREREDLTTLTWADIHTRTKTFYEH